MVNFKWAICAQATTSPQWPSFIIVWLWFVCVTNIELIINSSCTFYFLVRFRFKPQIHVYCMYTLISFCAQHLIFPIFDSFPFSFFFSISFYFYSLVYRLSYSNSMQNVLLDTTSDFQTKCYGLILHVCVCVEFCAIVSID